jgi:cytochrome oxidase Cu insertion factor (SCO1/SenC/PrrC family)
VIREYRKKTGSKLKQLLADPQSLNNYAYSRNNPVILIDPDGKWWKDVITGRQSFADFNVELGQAAQQMYDTSGVWKNAMDHPVATGIVVGVVGGAAAAGVSVVLGGSVTCGIICGSGGSSITILGASQADKASKILESGRGWSPGKIADSAKNLVEHFEKHASEIGAKNISQYYQKANDFIQNGYTNIFKEGADKVYYNVNNNLSAILDSNGNIKTFYRVENLNKINSYLERIANMK